MLDVYKYLEPALPEDHCRQSRATDLVSEHFKTNPAPSSILDLGCGIGSSIDFFRKVIPTAKWVGVDIEASPEVAARQRADEEFHTYDGMNLPFDDNSFDLIYSNQVLEHVRYPDKVLAEVSRVLSPTGSFIGQVSQLEPYHSFSIFNWTIYGFQRVCEENGLSVHLLRPGIDGVTLTERSFKERPDSYSQWFANESPLNEEIERIARKEGRRNKIINYRKLIHCGQFCFRCSPSL